MSRGQDSARRGESRISSLFTFSRILDDRRIDPTAVSRSSPVNFYRHCTVIAQENELGGGNLHNMASATKKRASGSSSSTQSPSQARVAYLVVYNLTQALAWSYLLYQCLSHLSKPPPPASLLPSETFSLSTKLQLLSSSAYAKFGKQVRQTSTCQALTRHPNRSDTELTASICRSRLFRQQQFLMSSVLPSFPRLVGSFAHVPFRPDPHRVRTRALQTWHNCRSSQQSIVPCMGYLVSLPGVCDMTLLFNIAKADRAAPSTQASPFFLPMVMAWCLAEIVRYLNYATALLNISIPLLETLRSAAPLRITSWGLRLTVFQILPVLRALSCWRWIRRHPHVGRPTLGRSKIRSTRQVGTPLLGGHRLACLSFLSHVSHPENDTNAGLTWLAQVLHARSEMQAVSLLQWLLDQSSLKPVIASSPRRRKVHDQ